MLIQDAFSQKKGLISQKISIYRRIIYVDKFYL